MSILQKVPTVLEPRRQEMPGHADCDQHQHLRQPKQVQLQASSAHRELHNPTSSSVKSEPEWVDKRGFADDVAAGTPLNRFDDATELASDPDDAHHMHTSEKAHHSLAHPQFMSGLMGLHGITTPEEKRKREDRQKQYARELDEQVTNCCCDAAFANPACLQTLLVYPCSTAAGVHILMRGLLHQRTSIRATLRAALCSASM